MTSVRRAALFGFLIWLIPFVAAFAAFPLREPARPLFESIMPVVIALVTVFFGTRYLRHVHRRYRFEGLLVGLIWVAMSMLIDAPLMLFGGPMQMTLAEYLADIGLTYAMIPIITVGLAVGFRSGRHEGAGNDEVLPHAPARRAIEEDSSASVDDESNDEDVASEADEASP